MIQVWLYDENKVFTESTLVEEVTENMTTVPLLIGYIKPTFNEELQEWFEGATEEEIKEWEEANKVVEEPNKMEVRLGQIEEAVGMLATQVAKNTLLQNGGMR